MLLSRNKNENKNDLKRNIDNMGMIRKEKDRFFYDFASTQTIMSIKNDRIHRPIILREKLNFHFLSLFWKCGLDDIMKYDSLFAYFIMYKLTETPNILNENKCLLSLIGSWYGTAKKLILKLQKRFTSKEELEITKLQKWISREKEFFTILLIMFL